MGPGYSVFLSFQSLNYGQLIQNFEFLKLKFRLNQICWMQIAANAIRFGPQPRE